MEINIETALQWNAVQSKHKIKQISNLPAAERPLDKKLTKIWGIE